MKLRLALAVCFAWAFSFAQNADSVKAKIIANPNWMASIYAVYPEPVNEYYTKAPAGYKPFYISHYGRHGERYYSKGKEVEFVYTTLAKADSAHKLTEFGKSVFERFQILWQMEKPRFGDLTQNGVRTHEKIAARMLKNFPEVFAQKSPYVEAFASTSGRCIVSMAAFMGELRAERPNVKARLESGSEMMKFIMNFSWNDAASVLDSSAWKKEDDKLWQNVNRHIDPMLKKIFADSAYVANNVKASDFYNQFFEISGNLQDMDSASFKGKRFDFLDVFPPEALFDRWQAQNAMYYGAFANCPITKKHGPNLAREALKNFIVEADKAIAADTSHDKNAQSIAATFRFGHDLMLLSLAPLMQLSSANAETSNLDSLYLYYRDYEVAPMGANIQWIFYKSSQKGAPILVKMMHNEREVTVPITCDEAAAGKFKCPKAPYYRWDDVRRFYSE